MVNFFTFIVIAGVVMLFWPRGRRWLLVFVLLLCLGFWSYNYLTSHLEQWGPWQAAIQLFEKYARGRSPTTVPDEATAQAKVASDRQINSCVDQAAHNNHAGRYLAACVGKVGPAYQTCVVQTLSAHGDDSFAAAAIGDVLKCRSFNQVHHDIRNITQSYAYAWLKSKICKFGRWVGLDVCKT